VGIPIDWVKLLKYFFPSSNLYELQISTMAKSKLIAALDAYKGKNYKLTKQKKLQKEAAKRKKGNAPAAGSEEKETVEVEASGTLTLPDAESEGGESDKSEAAERAPVN